MATEPGHADHGHADENPLAEGLERQPVHPTTLTIFGATGDLSKRKLLPALYNLAHEGALPERFNLIGSSRSELSARRLPRAGHRVDQRVLAPRARPEGAGGAAQRRAVRVRRVRRGRRLRAAQAAAAEFDEQAGITFNRVFYLSTAPSFFPVIVGQLGKHGSTTTTTATCAW